MYCYNYKFIEMVFDWLRKGDFKNTSGYIPLNGHIRNEIVENGQSMKKQSIETDYVKLFYLEQLVKEASEKGIRVLLVVSPSWMGGNLSAEGYAGIKNIAKKYSAQFIEYIDSEICNNPDNFEDSSHLNDKGARGFTDDLVSKIK